MIEQVSKVGVQNMEIKLVHVTKSFGAKQVIQPTSFVIQSGSLTTLLGPSGCGKTTLLRMIAGLETPDSGEIWFENRCVFSSEKKINIPPEKRGLGFVFQDFALWPHMTVFENVAFGLRAAGKTDKLDEKVKNALHAVQLDDFAQRYPHQLSGGQQQRVAFARAIVIEPACILFDEPLSALDALLREEMRSELRTLITKLGITGVFVTHDQIEAMSMSDAIAVCHAGKIEQYDTPEKIYSHPATEFVARFVGSSNWLDQNHLFRPEQAQTVPTEQAEKYDVDVTAVQFLGSSYQLQLNHNGQDWTYISPRRVSVGEKISLYLPRSAIVAV
jgi:iron(III) transport system ATP-binding protein